MKTLALAAALFGLLVAHSASAASVHVVVAPAKIAPGGAIRVTAAKSPCLSADTVSAISAAFPGDAFGSEGALTGAVTRDGAFTIHGHIRKGLHAGRYTIGFRCGGGNLGVSAPLRVS